MAKQNSWLFKALELTKCTRLSLTFNGVFFGDTPLSVVQYLQNNNCDCHVLHRSLNCTLPTASPRLALRKKLHVTQPRIAIRKGGVVGSHCKKKKDFAVELVLNCVLDKRMPCQGDRNLEINLLSVILEIWSRYMLHQNGS